MFLDQDYSNSVQLIYNNSDEPLELDKTLPQDRFKLVNNSKDLVTGGSYKTLGAIYRDAITFIPEDIDVVSFWDDDDAFLPNHISEGVKGLLKGGKSAYKPHKSYFYNSGVISLMHNVLEPSIFIKKKNILESGFFDSTGNQHIKWVEDLLKNNDIYEDKDGIPTLMYMWGDKTIPVYKTSGSRAVDNFDRYNDFSQDKGDNIISPCERKVVDLLINKIK